MTKILKSFSVIAFVAAVALAGTGAYFSDTETSTGNTFTAGDIDLTVDSEQHYNGNVCVENIGVISDPIVGGTPDYVWKGDAAYPVVGTACNGTWDLTDLGATHKFFDFGDIKPGDFGENTISLHIESNDAYACVDIYVTKNDDMSCTEPELETGADPSCADDNGENDTLLDGELAQNVHFTVWADDANDANDADVFPGNNILDAGEVLLFTNISGPLSDVLDAGGKSYMLAGPGHPLTKDDTTYIGLAWCAGTMNVTSLDYVTGSTGLQKAMADTEIECDGATMGNDCQTDSMEATISFRVEQARHNDGFTCVLPTVIPTND